MPYLLLFLQLLRLLFCHVSYCIVLCVPFQVGPRAVRLPTERDGVELRAREAQPASVLARGGLQPGRLPRRPGGPPQHQQQVGPPQKRSFRCDDVLFSVKP